MKWLIVEIEIKISYMGFTNTISMSFQTFQINNLLSQRSSFYRWWRWHPHWLQTPGLQGRGLNHIDMGLSLSPQSPEHPSPASCLDQTSSWSLGWWSWHLQPTKYYIFFQWDFVLHHRVRLPWECSHDVMCLCMESVVLLCPGSNDFAANMINKNLLKKLQVPLFSRSNYLITVEG